MIDLASLQVWFWLQTALEFILVVLMVVFMFKLRRLSRNQVQVPEELGDAVSNFLAESEKLSATFNQTLQEKKELSLSLLLKLERKINDLNGLLARAEEGLDQVRQGRGLETDSERANPAALENRAMVVRLAEQGLSVDEIARQVRLHKGEVELIIDLDRQFNL